MRDDELRARMGIRARARIAKEYSYPLFRERLRQCYAPFAPVGPLTEFATSETPLV
jgi:hypothetical protein